MIHRCTSCEKTWTSKELKDPKDILRRLTPGDIFPSGECPDCGAFCYPASFDNENRKAPSTIEEHLLYLCAHLSDLKSGLKEVANELRKKNKTEEARLQFNQKKQRMEALNFLKEEGLLDMLTHAKEKFKEHREDNAAKKEEPVAEKEDSDVDSSA